MSDRYEKDESENGSLATIDRDWLDLFDFPFGGLFTRPERGFSRVSNPLMRTDVTEEGDDYVMEIELPGVEKKDISVSLKGGYLSIQVNQSEENKKERKDYVVKERFTGTSKRSFYVGNHLRKEDIHAHLENGILRLSFPRSNSKKAEEQSAVQID